MHDTILITGAQGFIGRYLVQHWLDAEPDSRLVGIGRSRPLANSFTHPVHWGQTRLRAPLPATFAPTRQNGRYRYCRQDLCDRRGLVGLLAELRPTIVVHVAGALRDAPAPQLLRSNVLATEALFSAVAEASIPPPLVLLTSTGSLYRPLRRGEPALTESHACVPIDVYSATKRASEDVARVLANRYRLRWACARIFNVVGPGQDERHLCGWVARQLVSIREGLVDPELHLGRIDTTRDFMDVRDVAAALHAIARRGASGRRYNVATGVETPVRRVCRDLMQIAGLNGDVTVRYRRSRSVDPKRSVADVTELRNLDYVPRFSLPVSLADVVTYYAEDVARAATRRQVLQSRRPFARALSVSNDRSHRYAVQVEVGLLRRLAGTLTRTYPGARLAVLTDENVQTLYGQQFLASIRASGAQAHSIVIPAGEESKTMDCAIRIIEDLFRFGFDRRALLVNFGGGTVTDIGGFVAAVYMRGINYVNVPTTLLAQHDAAVGGKVAINAPWAKNFIGAFHDPEAVYCDPVVLRTLDRRSLAAGVAEAIKVAIIGERPLFELLEVRADAVMRDRDAELLGEIVARAAACKVELLRPDPFEVDLRRALNLGHTFGHPLETAQRYAGILHGEAVAFGIAVATAISHARGICCGATASRIYSLLAAYGLPPCVPKDRLLDAIHHLQAVRMVRGNHLHFVLPEGIGSVRIVPEVEVSELEAAIQAIAADPVIGASVGRDNGSHTRH